MGACSSADDSLRAAAKASKSIDDNLKDHQSATEMKSKLLLLGAGDSGKSTILKQFRIIHLDGFSEEEAKGYRVAVHRNIIWAMHILVQATHDYVGLTGKISDANAECAERVLAMSVDEKLTEDASRVIKKLWEDPAIQAAIVNEGKLTLEGSIEHFMKRIDIVGREDYIPSTDDILHARVRTTGVHALTFFVGDLEFQCIDVGGQRNERKKWISHFDNVDAILFIASLAEYDKVLREDGKTNRMHESNRLFQEICQSPYFGSTSILLFLNKRDVFADKVTKVDLNVCYKDYMGGKNYDNALKYIKKKYDDIKSNYHTKEVEAGAVYTHVTCATDTGNVRFVFDACKHIIITGSLESAGMI